jgi:hypothetical protein
VRSAAAGTLPDGQQAPVLEVRSGWPSRFCGGGIGDDRDLEAQFEELTQVALNAQVGRHSCQHYLVDAALAQLQQQVVLLRPIHLVRAADDGPADAQVGLVCSSQSAPEPVKPCISSGPGRSNIPISCIFCSRVAAELPSVVVREVVVGRDEHRDIVVLGADEQLLDVLHRAVLALVNQLSGGTLGAREVVLRVREDYSGVAGRALHEVLLGAAGVRQRPARTLAASPAALPLMVT